MSSAKDTLKNLLGENAEEKIQEILKTLNTGEGSDNEPATQAPPPLLNSDNLNYLLRIKDIIDEMGSSAPDSRSNLLLSLKPFMRTSRQHSIDSAVRLLGLTKLTSLFKS